MLISNSDLTLFAIKENWIISRICAAIELFVKLLLQVPSREVDKDGRRFWTHWNKETKQVTNTGYRVIAVAVHI